MQSFSRISPIILYSSLVFVAMIMNQTYGLGFTFGSDPVSKLNYLKSIAIKCAPRNVSATNSYSLYIVNLLQGKRNLTLNYVAGCPNGFALRNYVSHALERYPALANYTSDIRPFTDS